MALHQLDIYGRTKLEITIERLRRFEPPEGYYLAFSGGKDSVALKGVADLAGVKYDAHYNVASVDAPETVQFIKEYHPDVIFGKARYKDGTPITMWNLIPKKKMPPTRLVRYCCDYLKEGEGHNRFVLTGVRWAESSKRAKRGGLEVGDGIKGRGIRENIDPDNPDQEMIHICQQKAQRILNPLIDWTDGEVWEFIKENNLPYCKLYDEGFKRVGCVGCPMAGAKRQKEEFERWPKIKRNYLKAFERMLIEREKAGMETQWKTPEEVMEWWLGDDAIEEDAGLLMEV